MSGNNPNCAQSVSISIRDMPELVTVKQVAEAAQVSKQTVYNLIKDGRINAVNVRGRTFRLNRDEICDYFGL